jgi:5'-methylthioinosine phosphorylase
MSRIGVIGGSGFYEFPELENATCQTIDTTYGVVSDAVLGQLSGVNVVFIPRHGRDHKVPPHKVNYRANVEALSILNVSRIVAINAVGGIHPDMLPGSFVLPDQVIDYTYERQHTFFDGDTNVVEHIEFGDPFDAGIRRALASTLKLLDLPYKDFGVYGCTQGPRLETKAEIQRLRRDGCDVVGMTVMPEAALAREKKMAYASLCVVANCAAGLSTESISISRIMALLDSSGIKIREVLLKTLRSG